MRGFAIVVVLLTLMYGWRLLAPPPAAQSPAAYRLSGIAPSTPQASLLLGIPIDPNTASVADFEVLPGVGPKLAGEIVAHRAAHGPFRRAEDLLAVRGIGPRLLAKIGPWIALPSKD